MSGASDQKKLCFVAGPIGHAGSAERGHADWLLKGIIRPVFDEHFPEFYVERADEIAAPGMIDSQVINRLHSAPLVIIDMSFQNANAFYEMGIRHMKRLPTIHMYREGEVIPFDVKPYRAVDFKFTNPDDLAHARAKLKAAVEVVIQPGFEVENPVTRARGIEELDEHVMPVPKVIVEHLAAMQDRMETLENVTASLVRASFAPPSPDLGTAGLFGLAALRPGQYSQRSGLASPPGWTPPPAPTDWGSGGVLPANAWTSPPPDKPPGSAWGGVQDDLTARSGDPKKTK